ncbi:MAG: glycosyltransferase family protein [Alphaproteobacteria bacterium]|nr:MAG: glycosyltransferase family protein [Alphaproteobacteria bacterium]
MSAKPFDRALALHQSGQLDAAERLYREILQTEPLHAHALHLLGVLLLQRGRHNEALVAIDAALLGLPGHGPAHYHRAVALRGLGCADEAMRSCRHALELSPSHADAHDLLAQILRAQGQLTDALASHRQALALAPNNAHLHMNYGVALVVAGDYQEAEAAYRRALNLHPASAETHNNLGNLLRGQGVLDRAVCHYAKALEFAPDYHVAAVNKGLAHLLQGGWNEGMALFERRPAPPFARHLDPARRWRVGQPMPKRLLVYAEQGFGDSIQFARFLPGLVAQGVQVHLRVQAAVLPLMAGLGCQMDMAVDDPALPTPDHDAHAPLMSLPYLCGINPYVLPSMPSYLCPDPARGADWESRLPLAMPGRQRLGIVWAGSTGHLNDRNRSLDFERLKPLLDMPGIQWVSLQKDRLPSCGLPEGMAEIGTQLGDFADTAAALQNLDGLVTVDTATAHLAGALGLRAYVLLPFIPDWRWGLGGVTTPWYASLTLIRQPALGDWDEAINALVARLSNGPV